MSEKAWDNGRFGGYHTRRSAQEDAELTHVGRGTPGGEYLRRFWHPIALAEELTDVPLALRVLGEDLVLFRDRSGRLGLLHRQCSHRGASLEYGIVSAHGIRCCYHGWLYDVDGTILETPAEPETSRVRFNLRPGAYPTCEQAGLIFAYLGPPEDTPELPVYDSWTHPTDNELVPFKLAYACNWLQYHENTADPMHIPFLHGRVSGVQFAPGFEELPALSFADTPIGMVTASTRHVQGTLWVRTADVILPNAAQFPPAFETGEAERFVLGAWATRWIVPSDDTHSWVIGFRHFNAVIDPFGQGCRSEVGIETLDFAGQVAAPPAERQRHPGDYEAIVGLGPIAVHANEHPVGSDRGVIALRKLIRKGIHCVREGRPLELPRRYARAAVPTYTYELIRPWPAQSDTSVLQRLGDEVLRVLVDSAAEPYEGRARSVATRLQEIARCP
jgi:nitrite reductase/ring-hydroxylating ferredoxin subunit